MVEMCLCFSSFPLPVAELLVGSIIWSGSSSANSINWIHFTNFLGTGDDPAP